MVWSLGQEDPLQEGTATYSSILAWEITWTEEPDGLQSKGSKELDTTEQTKHKHKTSTFYLHDIINGKIDVTTRFKITMEKNSPTVPCYNGLSDPIPYSFIFYRVANMVYIPLCTLYILKFFPYFCSLDNYSVFLNNTLSSLCAIIYWTILLLF